MQSNRSSGTSPEMAVRRQLHAKGLRFRVNYRLEPEIRRTADIVLTRARLAVFIDGCFWHGCPEHYQRPAINRDYWDSKLTRNHERDVETNALLAGRGWTVLRVWEHVPTDVIVDEILRIAKSSVSP